jgi:hypothetical protein
MECLHLRVLCPPHLLHEPAPDPRRQRAQQPPGPRPRHRDIRTTDYSRPTASPVTTTPSSTIEDTANVRPRRQCRVQRIAQAQLNRAIALDRLDHRRLEPEEALHPRIQALVESLLGREGQGRRQVRRQPVGGGAIDAVELRRHPRAPMRTAVSWAMTRSTSTPISAVSSCRAATATDSPSVWAIDPTNPSGHCGAPSLSRARAGGVASYPAASSAAVAQNRPARKVARRLGTARARNSGTSSAQLAGTPSSAAARTKRMARIDDGIPISRGRDSASAVTATR